MDTHTSRHGEEPNPLPLKVFDSPSPEEKQEDAVTFWKKTGSFENQQLSETETETSLHFHHPTPSNQSERDYCFSEEFLPRNDIYFDDDAKLEQYEKRSSRTTDEKYFQSAPHHSLQSLSHFFTEKEIQMMTPPDAVLSVEDRFFVVLPNTGVSGSTLFHCLSQAITGDERDQAKLRDNVVDYICSQEGWDLLGHYVVSFYEPFIDEFRTPIGAEHFGGSESDKYRRRVYRHYFTEEEYEGSLVELMAASIIYGFSFTCIFLQEGDKNQAKCRIFNSFDETMVSERKEISHFLRVGETPEDWRWTLVVPYLANIRGDIDGDCSRISRGSYDAKLWNVYGLKWSGGTQIKPFSSGQFNWKDATSVITTKSGKLLGGYLTSGKDLFSCLSCLLPNFFQSFSLHEDEVSYCPKKRSRWKMKNHGQGSVVGTLKDLQKASKNFKFGYYVVGINEQGRFQTLACRDKKRIVYLIARTSNDLITQWCALGDMRDLEMPLESEENKFNCFISSSESRTSSLESHADCNRSYVQDRSLVKNKTWKDSWRLYKSTPFRIRISKYFARLRLLIRRRIKGRNKVHHSKFFPLRDIDIITL